MIIQPEILTSNNKLAITDNVDGTITIDNGQEIRLLGQIKIDLDSYDNTARTLSHLASKTYHVRYSHKGDSINSYTPTANTFYIVDVDDVNYNPSALAESNSVFDSTLYDVLIAIVVTDGANSPTITSIINKAISSVALVRGKDITGAMDFWDSTNDGISYAKNVTIQGDFTVNGTKTEQNVETLTVDDNIITTNDGEVGAGVTGIYAGLEIDRGTEQHYRIVFNESLDVFAIGLFYYDLPYSSLSGSFSVGETITGGTSAAIGIVVSDNGSNAMSVNLKTPGTPFQAAETITGGTSDATSTVTSFTANNSNLQAVATRENSPTSKGITFWNDTDKRLDTASTFIYDNDKVGIGTTDPKGRLHIYDGNAGTDPAWSAGDMFIIENDGAARIQFFNPADASAWVQFSKPGGRHMGSIGYGHSDSSYNDSMMFSTAEVERMRLNNAGNLSIGTINSFGKLHIFSGSSGAAAAHMSADELVIEGGGNSGINILTPSNSIGSIRFGDPGQSDIGSIRYDHNDNSMGIFVKNSQVMWLNGVGTTMVGIGVDPVYKFHVYETDSSRTVSTFRTAQTTTIRGMILFRDGNNHTCGDITIDTGANTTTYNTTSDVRLKKNIVDYKDGLQTIMAMSPRKFNWKSDNSESVGFIAQELMDLVPYAVSGDPDGDISEAPMSVDYGRVTPYLVAAIKELKQEIEQLKVGLL